MEMTVSVPISKPEAASSLRGQIRKGLLRQIFSGSSMHRWNDKLRPCPLAEIDKQSHKMIVAALLLSRASRGMSKDAWLGLAETVIEGALFEYLFRTITTDIKPPVFYLIQKDAEQYARLTDYVLQELEPVLSPLGDFWTRFQAWHAASQNREVQNSAPRRLLNAAHQFASQWEFRLIRPLNRFDPEMRTIACDFKKRLSRLSDVPGMEDILNGKTALSHFASFCGQLRFQVRWTQIPRIPQTDVLGHVFFVGTMAYLYSHVIGACRARRVNNFFGGLFHDLPELLTRDIISPVKKSSRAMAELIRECEHRELTKRIFQPLDEAGETEFTSLLHYCLGLDCGQEAEFAERWKDGTELRVAKTFEELDAQRNEDRFDALDGRLVKACDTLSAFLEADDSVCNGISSRYLVSARQRLRDSLCDREKTPAVMGINALMSDYD